VNNITRTKNVMRISWCKTKTNNFISKI